MIDDTIEFLEPYTYLIVGSIKALVIAGGFNGSGAGVGLAGASADGAVPGPPWAQSGRTFGLGQPISDSIKLYSRNRSFRVRQINFYFTWHQPLLCLLRL